MNKFTLVVVSTACLLCSINASACGGFFCSFLPIQQAAEQIVFRKDGDQITTMVRISYSGDAENFAWVLPVPNTPEISIGNDRVFSDLESATRPQFNLERTGEACRLRFPPSAPSPVPTNAGEPNEGGDVVVEQTLTVGPFDAQVISGTDSGAVATWLAENKFDLTDRGAELLEPYVSAGMKFVVLKLQSDRDVGDIQPIILKYQGEKPMIPLRLTAVAAEDDMGVMVWLLSDSRAVPDNFLHVTPNYTRLNWYTGSRNAYVSYQTLITAAMNEAGGQGFATDFAGKLPDLLDSLTSVEPLVTISNNLASASNADYISTFWRQSFNLDPRIGSSISTLLPLPTGQSSAIYEDPVALATQYTMEALTEARQKVSKLINDDIIISSQNALDILDDDLYMTRMYTTLSADEMSVDPSFVFNADMPAQDLVRNATLNAACKEKGTEWTLTLGQGTGRTDEVVIEGRGQPLSSAPVTDQNASWQIAETFSKGSAKVTTQRNFALEKLGGYEVPSAIVTPMPTPTPTSAPSPVAVATPEPVEPNRANGSSGGGAFGWISVIWLFLALAARRSRLRINRLH